MAYRSNAKLAAKFFGPFQVLKRIGPVAYLLDLPQDSKLHPVFHVSVLKPHVGTSIPVSSTLPIADGPPVQPQAVLDQRRRKGIDELLVHWSGHSPADATWEPKSDLISRFPDFTLEDKGDSKGEGMLLSSSY